MRHFLARPVRAHPIRVASPAVPTALEATARLAYLTPNRLSRALRPAVAEAPVAHPAQQEPLPAQNTETLNEISKVQAAARAAVDLKAESWDSTERGGSILYRSIHWTARSTSSGPSLL